MRTRALLATILTLTVSPALAADAVVHVRVIKGYRAGPAEIDPRLAPMKRLLAPLAYVRWQQLSEQNLDLVRGKTQFVELPNGADAVGITLEEHRGNTMTLEVALTQRNTQSRLTVHKGQRILHGVLPEKNGEAVFIVVNGWP